MKTPSFKKVLLKTTGLCYSIEQSDILKDITLHIKQGELLGLIGPNGAGKSTLLRLLTSINEASAGSIEFKGKPLEEISAEKKSKQIAYLAQGAKAHWPMSVENIVQLGRIPHQKWWQGSSTEDKAKTTEALQLTETTSLKDRLVTTLSGGEQTLVMLARIFATDPQLIFADEPVAALDPYHQLHVMELLKSHSENKKSAVIVLHDLNLAARFCDRLYLLNKGEIFCEGTPEEVLTSNNIQQVYGIKSNVTLQVIEDKEIVNINPEKRVLNFTSIEK